MNKWESHTLRREEFSLAHIHGSVIEYRLGEGGTSWWMWLKNDNQAFVHGKADSLEAGREAAVDAARAYLRAALTELEGEYARVTEPSPASPDDLRAAGWWVASHYDRWERGEMMTMWMMAQRGGYLHGTGKTDAEALNSIRRQIADRAETDVVRSTNVA